MTQTNEAGLNPASHDGSSRESLVSLDKVTKNQIPDRVKGSDWSDCWDLHFDVGTVKIGHSARWVPGCGPDAASLIIHANTLVLSPAGQFNQAERSQADRRIASGGRRRRSRAAARRRRVDAIIAALEARQGEARDDAAYPQKLSTNGQGGQAQNQPLDSAPLWAMRKRGQTRALPPRELRAVAFHFLSNRAQSVKDAVVGTGENNEREKEKKVKDFKKNRGDYEALRGAIAAHTGSAAHVCDVMGFLHAVQAAARGGGASNACETCERGVWAPTEVFPEAKATLAAILSADDKGRIAKILDRAIAARSIKRKTSSTRNALNLAPTREDVIAELDAVLRAQVDFAALSEEESEDLRAIITEQIGPQPGRPGRCRFLKGQVRGRRACPSLRYLAILETIGGVAAAIERRLGVILPEETLVAEARRRLRAPATKADIARTFVPEIDSTDIQQLFRNKDAGTTVGPSNACVLFAATAGLDGFVDRLRRAEPEALTIADDIVDRLTAASHRPIEELTGEIDERLGDGRFEALMETMAREEISLEKGFAQTSPAAALRLIPILVEEGCQIRAAEARFYAALRAADETPEAPLRDAFAPGQRKFKAPGIVAALPDDVYPTKTGAFRKGPSGGYHRVLVEELDLTNSRYRRILNAVAELVEAYANRKINGRRLGRPRSITLETCREFAQDAKKKREIAEHNKRLQAARQEREKLYGRYFKDYDARADLRVELWERQGKQCPYSFKQIPEDDLNSPNWEIDHIIPFSFCASWMKSNLVLAAAEENRKKTNCSLRNAFGENQAEAIANWAAAGVEAKRLPPALGRRLGKKNQEMFDHYRDKTHRRSPFHEGGTKTAARLLAKYLSALYPAQTRKDGLMSPISDHVRVISGKQTSLLRRAIGRVLLKDDDPAVHDPYRPPVAAFFQHDKFRGDTRSHAVDALIGGLAARDLHVYTNPRYLRRLGARSFEEALDIGLRRDRGFPRQVRALVADLDRVIPRMTCPHKARKRGYAAIDGLPHPPPATLHTPQPKRMIADTVTTSIDDAGCETWKGTATKQVDLRTILSGKTKPWASERLEESDDEAIESIAAALLDELIKQGHPDAQGAGAAPRIAGVLRACRDAKVREQATADGPKAPGLLDAMTRAGFARHWARPAGKSSSGLVLHRQDRRAGKAGLDVRHTTFLETKGIENAYLELWAAPRKGGARALRNHVFRDPETRTGFDRRRLIEVMGDLAVYSEWVRVKPIDASAPRVSRATIAPRHQKQDDRYLVARLFPHAMGVITEDGAFGRRDILVRVHQFDNHKVILRSSACDRRHDKKSKQPTLDAFNESKRNDGMSWLISSSRGLNGLHFAPVEVSAFGGWRDPRRGAASPAAPEAPGAPGVGHRGVPPSARQGELL